MYGYMLTAIVLLVGIWIVWDIGHHHDPQLWDAPITSGGDDVLPFT